MSLNSSGCAAEQELSQWRARFNLEASRRGAPSIDELPVDWAERGELGFTQIGMCKLGRITLNQPWWELAPDCKREALIFHEIGHCDFDLEHTESGVMAPSIPPDYCTDDKRVLYLDQFFEQVKETQR